MCELFDHPNPAAADPTGVSFTFECGAAKHGGGDGNTAIDRRRRRRSLTIEELSKLVEAAEINGTIEGIDGPTRATEYVVAVHGMSKNLPILLPIGHDFSRRSVAGNGNNIDQANSAQNITLSVIGDGCGMVDSDRQNDVKSSPSRARTYNLAVNSRSLYH